MGWKEIFALVFILLVVGLLALYWFAPFKDVEFETGSKNSNFSLNSIDSTDMQFYNNMRYSEKEISYKISDECNLQKKASMEQAFDMIEEVSILSFYSVENKEEISIACDEKQRLEAGLFVAGEGGPTNITQAGTFNVILNGKILLIRDSNCPNPNVALHELLHALGFDHSNNPNSIMYNFSDCSQTMGAQIPSLLNSIYEMDSLPDLVFEEVTPYVHGKYLDVNMSIRNNGLKDAGSAIIEIYADDKLENEINLESLGLGFGMKLMSVNIHLNNINADEFRFVIKSDFDELDKSNNEIVFSVKK